MMPWLLAAAVAMPAAAAGFEVVGDAIPAPLTATPGDSARGFAVVAGRQVGTCVLCHAGPFPAERRPATIGPDLRGVADRLSPAQIRLRLVDPARVNPETVMPAYFRTEGLVRVGQPWQGRPALTAQQIEDAVAFLATLKEE
jgi:sulfur-oxidizing protein SoxX